MDHSFTCTWLPLDFNDCHCSKLQTTMCAHLTFPLKLKPRWNITNTEISLCPDKNFAKSSCEQNLKKLFNVTWSAYQTRSDKTLQGLQLTYKTNQSDKSAKNKNRWSKFFFFFYCSYCYGGCVCSDVHRGFQFQMIYSISRAVFTLVIRL